MGRRDGIGPDLRGRSLLITGGGTGIGAATALDAARAGMRVMVTGRRSAPLAAVVDAIEAEGGEAAALVIDVTDEGASASMLDAMDATFGGADAIFANAGYGIEKPVLDADASDVRRIFDVNLIAAVDLLRAGGVRMRDAGRPGHLLGCSSILGKFTLPRYGIYSATKAALTHVCRSMRTELSGSGIAVSSIHPVTTRTEFFDVALQSSGEGHGPALRADGTPRHAPRMFVQPPERVSRAVVRCLRRPRAEVWTTLGGRLANGVFELVPPIYDLVLRSAGKA
ncbi:MAG: SDR family NAD(P)-dependent oxidoreductase [Planctomycetota bacterium]|nr:SDR family NAD(P)-dependent oxidoreductase [Planctomycetota bacterium]